MNPPHWAGSRPSIVNRHALVRRDAHYTERQSYTYSHPVPSGWGSYDYFPVRPAIALPPQLPPLHPPTRFMYCEECHQGPSSFSNRLRRWGNYQSLNAAANTATPLQQYSYHIRSSREVQSRGDIGSMQQLPTASFVSQSPHWHQSCRGLAPTSGTSLVCVFCKSNREPPEVYTSHQLRDKKGAVICPILRNYRCRFCGATGDAAHTDSYCPENPHRGFRGSMKSVLQTRLMSSGKMRADSSSASSQP